MTKSNKILNDFIDFIYNEEDQQDEEMKAYCKSKIAEFLKDEPMTTIYALQNAIGWGYSFFDDVGNLSPELKEALELSESDLTSDFFDIDLMERALLKELGKDESLCDRE